MTTKHLQCLLLLSLLITVNGSAINFTSTSTSIKPLVTQDLTLRCDLHDTAPSVSGGLVGRRRRETFDSLDSQTDSSITADSQQLLDPKRSTMTNSSENVDFVTSLVISRDGQDLASVSEHVSAKPMVSSPDFTVTGSMSTQPGERGFLQLTWRHPTGSQTGTFRCDISAVSRSGHSFDFSTSLQVDQGEDVTFQDLVEKLLKMEKEKDNMADTINTLTSNIHTLQQANTDLTSKVNKLDIQVFFSAGLTTADGDSGHHYPRDAVVIFDKVFSNIGSGYDPNTGVFTSPQSGYYKFTISIRNHYNQDAAVKLLHNNVSVIHLDILNAGFATQGENSVILKVEKGDTMKVVDYGSQTYLYSDSTHVLCTFDGQLLNAS